MSTLATLDIDRITVEQKLDLIGRLWGSIPEADLPPLTEAQMRELERRIADADANPHLGRRGKRSRRDCWVKNDSPHHRPT